MSLLRKPIEESKPIELFKNADILNELDWKTWLPFAAKPYHISPNPDDYVIVATPIIPSDLPNRNGVGFPLNQLLKFDPVTGEITEGIDIAEFGPNFPGRGGLLGHG